MFFLKLYIVAITLLIFLFTLIIQVESITKDGIKLIKGWQPEPVGGKNKTHYITTLGNAENYQIKADQYEKGKLSNAICNSTISSDGKTIASNLCSTCAKDHDQIFTVICTSNSAINPFAIIQFGQNDEIKVWTIGDIWISFQTLLEVTILLQSALPNKPLHSRGDDVSVIVSCIGKHPDNALQSYLSPLSL